MAQTFSSALHLSGASVAATAAPLSMVIWVNSSGGQSRRFFELCASGADTNLFGVLLDVTGTASNKVSAYRSSAVTSNQALSSVALTTGSWQHAASVFSSSSAAAAYLNGVNKSTSSVTVTPSGINLTTISGRQTDYAFGVAGQAAHAAVWARALSDVEIAYLGTGGNPRAVKSCVSYWKLATVAGVAETPVADRIGSNDLTASGTIGVGTSDPNLQSFMTGGPIGALSYTQGSAITSIDLSAGHAFDDVSSAFTVTLQQATATATATTTSSALTAVREVVVASVSGFSAGDYIKIAAAAITRILAVNTTAVSLLVSDDQTYSSSATVTRYSVSPLTVAGLSITSNVFSGTPSAAVTNNNCFFRATCNGNSALMADTDVFTMTIASGGGGGSGGLLLFGDDMTFARFNGVQNECVPIWLPDSSSTTGAGKTGLTISSTGLIISTRADVEASATVYTAAGSTIETITTLGTYAAPTATKCRFKEVDATNFPGWYEMHFANTRFSVGNAGKLYITVLAPGSNVPPRNVTYDLGLQADVRAFGGVAGTFATGRPEVNTTHLGGSSTRVTALGLEMDVRKIGTITNATFTITNTQFECGDIGDSAAFPVYINRGFVITSGALIKGIGTILTDIVGTSGRRFTVAALQSTPANGDTILIG